MWDVFDSVRLEVQRGLSTEVIRAAPARGELRDDDLARPAGSSIPWTRIADLPGLHEAEPEPPPLPPVAFSAQPDRSLYEPNSPPDLEARTEHEPSSGSEFEYDDDTRNQPPKAAPVPPKLTSEPVTRDDLFLLDDDEDDQADQKSRETPRPTPARPADDQATIISRPPPFSSKPPAAPSSPPYFQAGPEPAPWSQQETLDDFIDPEDEDEAAAEFTLSRKGPDKVEELDLAAMVDVAFQLVLFFLVTATTVLYKTLEIPKPNPERPQAEAGAEQGLDSPRTLEDLQDDYILVNIDDTRAFTVDRQAVAADFDALAQRMRQARSETARTAMLLTAPSQSASPLRRPGLRRRE